MISRAHLKHAAGDEIGRVVEWMMDVQEGKVVYVVAEIDSSGKYYAIPWHFMKADLQHGGYIVDQDEIEKHDVSVDRNAMSNLVNDKDFLTKSLNVTASTSNKAVRPDNHPVILPPTVNVLRRTTAPPPTPR